MEYTLFRSRRRSICVKVTRNATVEVRAPLDMPESEISRFLVSRSGWISRHLEDARRRVSQRLQPLDEIVLMGAKYPIEYGGDGEISFDYKSFKVPEGFSDEELKMAAVRFYKLMAREILTAKVRAFGEIMGVKPAGVRINSAKTRWGSCGASGRLNFSWRLMPAPESLIDYVVVHELAHLREMNHSPGFWAIVESVIPDCMSRRKLLKEVAGGVWSSIDCLPGP